MEKPVEEVEEAGVAEEEDEDDSAQQDTLPVPVQDLVPAPVQDLVPDQHPIPVAPVPVPTPVTPAPAPVTSVPTPAEPPVQDIPRRSTRIRFEPDRLAVGGLSKSYCNVVRGVYKVKTKLQGGEDRGNSDRTVAMLKSVKLKLNHIVDMLGHLW